ncbi:MAG TPA: cbb3-type cytochrome oxidase assembly protein CcoS [Methylomirabilota bacterium]|nr:cbb3-type cytochrome oxidase assembly protein CcoS [Methylomirabilota bacterium]
MTILLYLVPIALFLGLIGLAAFLWSLKSGQYDDLDGAAWRAIQDDDLPDRPDGDKDEDRGQPPQK